MAEEAMAGERVCEFYLLPRGCVKGDKCDFAHPLSPCGNVTNKVCEYFLKPRGCIKGAQCDFLHPNLGPNGMKAQLGQNMQQKSVCKFYQEPRGCIKGATCDFMHPMMGMGGMGMGMGMQPGMGMGMMGMGGGMPSGDTRKPCEFFTQPRGCIKGSQCDFSHNNPMAMQQSQMFGMGMQQPNGMGFPGMGMDQRGGGPGRLQMTPMGPVNKAGQLMKPKVCDFFATEKGCVKGDMCEFVHQKQKPCEFFNSPKGCRKGKFCDFTHDGAPGDEDANAAGKVAKSPAGQRFAPY